MTDTLTGTPALDAVTAALATVQDPEINRPLTELGMVKDVQIGADGVTETTFRPWMVNVPKNASPASPGVPLWLWFIALSARS